MVTEAFLSADIPLYKLNNTHINAAVAAFLGNLRQKTAGAFGRGLHTQHPNTVYTCYDNRIGLKLGGFAGSKGIK